MCNMTALWIQKTNPKKQFAEQWKIKSYMHQYQSSPATKCIVVTGNVLFLRAVISVGSELEVIYSC